MKAVMMELTVETELSADNPCRFSSPTSPSGGLRLSLGFLVFIIKMVMQLRESQAYFILGILYASQSTAWIFLL